ncbi:hypothetical protein, partial [Geoalkalibacter ferrihydriticus]|uniref:hypothetical protein n=1 Tax=Geoalkalibacter ferrihydriticus TaxID=392333 RepID=UPI00126A0BB4
MPRPTNDNITNSFWDTQVSGLTTSAGGEGKTTAEMQILSTFNQAGWNIERDADLDNIFPFLSFTDDGNGGYTATWVVGKYLLNFALSDVGADGSIIYDGQAWLLGDYWAISEDIFGAAGAGFELGDDFIFVRNNESVSGFTNAGSYEGISVTLLNEDYRIASPGNTQG